MYMLKKIVSSCQHDTGNISIVAAAFLTAAIGATALAVDIGSLYHERRVAQGAVDLAAIVAANDLDHATAAARATLIANGITELDHLVVTLGQYTPDPDLPPTQRFSAGEAPANAVRVTLENPGQVYFARAFTQRPFNIEVSATASAEDTLAFSLGSRLAAIRGGVPNKVLGAMLGTNIDLSVMDYNALVSADIDLLDFLDTLATRINLEGATYDNVLATNVSAGDVMEAAASVCDQNGNSTAASALRILGAETTDKELELPLSNLIDLGDIGQLQAGQSHPGLVFDVAAMAIVQGTASIANGEHQVAVDFGANIPGLLSAKLDLAIGERSQYSGWFSVRRGGQVETAQTRLRLVVTLAGGTGIGTIRLPLYLELAYATAQASAVSCWPDTQRATIDVTPGIANIWIGEVSSSDLDTFGSHPDVSPARLVDLRLLKVTGFAHAEIGNLDPAPINFDQSEIEARAIKRAETQDFLAPLVSSAIGDLQLSVKASGLNLSAPSLTKSTILGALTNAASPIDQLLHSIADTLGLYLGEADVRVHGIRCGSGVLSG